jgi:hypothetical protein
MVPVPLAGLGVVASAVLLVILLGQRAEVWSGATDWSSLITWLQWLPVAVFEIALALWLIVKGMRAPGPRAG